MLVHPVPGLGGLPKLVLEAADGARVELHLHGAHVTSWVPAGGRERLFLSERSTFAPGHAIRGGVPVIFPQFSDQGPLPRHGFARSALWEQVDSAAAHPSSGATLATAALRLRHSEASRAVWPHAFDARLTVRVGGARLEIELVVRNTGEQPLAFTGALHSYLRVADVADVAVLGLAGVRYRDQTAGGAERVDGGPALRVTGEVDRVYLDVPGPVTVREPAGAVTCGADGFPDLVVWNPGPVKAAALADLEPGGHRRMLCVEAAVVGAPVRLASGERWTGRQTLHDVAAAR
jgi:glucose-6-phosphate 1-epimerase